MIAVPMSRQSIAAATPTEVRRAIRDGAWTDHTVGLASGFVQANLVILPRDLAYGFLLFCVRNPKSCPLVDVTDAGCPVPPRAAMGADLRTDLPRYRVYEHGELVEEPVSIEHRWRDDLVGFLLGCSYTFEHALIEAGVRLRHVEQGRNVPLLYSALKSEPT